MNLNDFDFDLPESLIAQKPLENRDDSRMLVMERSSGKITHAQFKNFPGFCKENDVLVPNKTRVLPARTWGKKGAAEIEFLFLKELSAGTWEVMCRPARKVKPGEKIVFSPSLSGVVQDTGDEGRRIIQFNTTDMREELNKIGFAPLPPYIKRKRGNGECRAFDLERYQTIFAQSGNSIAAPTAGLHFTPEVLKDLQTAKVNIAPVSLDVGLATFQPVRVTKINDHKMLTERFFISEETARTINLALTESRPVIAVGTTAVRSLESAAFEGRVKPGEHSTSLFIFPGYRYKIVTRLLTNFHLPKSTLLMLTSAFGGYDSVMHAYREAVAQRYRFFSYGDCMLIL